MWRALLKNKKVISGIAAVAIVGLQAAGVNVLLPVDVVSTVVCSMVGGCTE